MVDSLVSHDYMPNIIATAMGSKFAESRLLGGQVKAAERQKVFLDILRGKEKSGCSVSRRALDALNSYVKVADKHYRREYKASSDAGKPVRFDFPNKLRGNYAAWKLVLAAFKEGKKRGIIKHNQSRKYRDRIISSVMSMIVRSGNVLTKPEEAMIKEYFVGIGSEVTLPLMLKDIIKDELASKVREYNKFDKERDVAGYGTVNKILIRCLNNDDESVAKIKLFEKDDFNLNIVSIGPFCVVMIGEQDVVISHHHLWRALRLLDVLVNLTFFKWNLGLKDYRTETIDIIKEIFCDVIEDDVELAGEAVKGARSCLIASLDKAPIMEVNPVQSLLLTMKPERRFYANKIYRTLRELTVSPEDALNLACIYKFVPHPDANLHDAFESIQGLQDPNVIEENSLLKIKGIMRKSLFTSLHNSGYSPRLIGQTERAMLLERLSNEAVVRLGKMLEVSYFIWAETEFREVPKIVKPKDIIVPTSSKSSQQRPDSDIPLNLVEEDGHYTDEALKFFQEVKTLNDAVSEIKGISNLDAARSIIAFERMVRAHEEFEYENGYDKPEDIPPDVMQNFLLSTPVARSFVGTEPKFGEVHKKVTRIFYMAEQNIKAITQRVERVAKQVSRKQYGVSIVKSYNARRKDLEDFCLNMGRNSEGLEPLYISFDMSEFSKKFPMPLLRAYGQILSEICNTPWMSRIDIIFRSAIVLHNSRGYHNLMWNVKGGFEGFFNFCWSSIHASVMEMSLTHVGLQGNLLTFSDDGLLLIYVPTDWGNERIRDHVKVIQDTYRKCGLVFHISKTIVSKSVWEYLGDVCYKNKLVISWAKEVCSVGKRDNSAGIHPVYENIKAIQSQIQAAVEAGADPMTAYILKRLMVIPVIERIHPNITPMTLEAMLIVPASCGGIRITSPIEMGLSTTIPLDSEIIADLLLYRERDPGITTAIYNALLNNPDDRVSPLNAVLRESVFSNSFPDTSGLNVINKGIEEVKVTHGSARNLQSSPFDSPTEKRLNNILKRVDNLNLAAISDILRSSPQFVDYSRSVALMKSDGAIRLIRRSTIKRLQAEDTRNVRKSINLWMEQCRDVEELVDPLDLAALFNQLWKKVFGKVCSSPLKPSARICMSRTDQNGEINVRVDFPPAQSFSSTEYVEPISHRPSDFSSLAWFSEATGDITTKSIRRFALSCARAIASTPESEKLINYIALTFGMQLTAMPPGLVVSTHRDIGASHAHVDVNEYLIPAIQSCTSASYSENLSEFVYSLPRGDRTTYLSCAKVFASHSIISNFLALNRMERGVHYMRYNVSEDLVQSMHKNRKTALDKNFTMKVDWKVESLSENFKREYIATFKEYDTYAQYREAINRASTRVINYDSLDPLYLNELAIISIKKWMMDITKFNSRTILPEIIAPVATGLKWPIIRKALIQFGYDTMRPTAKSRFRDRLLGLDFANNQIQSLIDLAEDDGYEMYRNCLQRGVTILLESKMTGISEIDANIILNHPGCTVDELIKYCKSLSMVMGGRLVVMRSRDYHEGEFSRAHRQAFKESFRATLSDVYSTCRTLRWNRHQINRELRLSRYEKVDDLIDGISIATALIRESDHRGMSHPYNKISFKIGIYRYFVMLRAMITVFGEQPRLVREEMDQFARNFRMDDGHIANATSYSVGAGKVLGTDHEEMTRLGVSELEVKRASIIAILYLTTGEANGSTSTFFQTNMSVDQQLISVIENMVYFHVILPATRTIVQFPSELQNEILSNFTPTSASEVTLLGLKVEPRCYLGKPLKIGNYPPESRDDICMIVHSHIKEFAILHEIDGFRSVDFTDHYLMQSISQYASATGTTIAWAHSRIESDIKVALIRSNDVNRAITTYTNLASIIGSVTTIFYETITEQFIITSVFPSLTSDINIMDLDPLTLPQCSFTNKNDIASKLTMRTRAMFARMDINKIEDKARNETLSSAAFIAGYQRRIGITRQVNNDYPMLQAAIDISKMSDSSKDQLYNYVIVMLWLRGVSDPGKVRPGVRSLLRLMADRVMCHRITTDASAVHAWLKYSLITPGITLDLNEYRRAFDTPRDVECPHHIPQSISQMSHRRLSRVMQLEEVKGYDANSFTISSLILEVPPAISAILPSEPLELGEVDEDEEDFNAIMGL